MHIPSNLMLIFYILHPWDIVDYIYIVISSTYSRFLNILFNYFFF
jgi:hypothetical protein